jgi:hypothetical protein
MSYSNIADKLGKLRSEIKSLTDQQKRLEAILKDDGVVTVDGELFRVAISYGITANRVDWKNIAAKLHPSRQLITGNTVISIFDRVTVSALNKAA